MMRLRHVLVAATSFVLAGAALAEETKPSISTADIGKLCDQLASHPDDPQRSGVGVMLAAINVAAAEPACRKAVDANPGEPRYLFELGRVLRQKGDFAAALPLYQKAGDMGSAIALVGLGLFYEDGDGVTQDYDKAAVYYHQAADAGSALALRYLASLYEYGDIGDDVDYAEALRVYQQAVDKGDPISLARMGWLIQWGFGAAKDEARAEALFRRAIASGNPEAIGEGQNNLAWMLALSGTRLPEAEELSTAAVAGARSDDDFGRSAYLDTFAWVKHRLGKESEALAAEQEAISLADDNAPYYDRLGDIYAATGDSDRAVAAWKKALDLTEPIENEDPTFDPDEITRKIGESG